MKEPNNIEEVFQKAFEKFEADPGKGAWSAVQTGMKANLASASATSGAAVATSSWVSTAIVGLVITGLAVGGYFYFDQKAEQTKSASIEAPALTNEDNSNADESVNPKVTPTLKEDEVDAIDQPKEARISKIESSKEKAVITEKTDTKNSTESRKEEQAQKENISNNNSSSIAQEEIGETAVESTANQIDNDSPKEKDLNEALSSKQDKKVEPVSNEETLVNPSSIASSEEEETVNFNIEIPNIFTPNQDGVNDLFEINTSELDGIEVSIFNKTGKLVYEWNGLYGNWDGTKLDGSLAPEDIYIYQIILLKDGKRSPRKGTITLNR